MKKAIQVLGVLLSLAYIVSCTKVPITGRKQMNLMPESEMIGMSLQAYDQFLSESKVVAASDSRTQMVKRIGEKIKTSVEQFLTEKKQIKRIEGFQWEFNLVDDPAVNAWCMPGGKVVVYTGILPVTADEASLAVVMGHEIAHAIARHGNERMSQGLLFQAGGIALSVLLSDKPQLAQGLFLQSYGIGGELGILAFSRQHELEADKMGLIFMAMGGYDPRVAPTFWERMASQGGQAPPELLSTHPSDDTRIRELKEYMPEALKYYKE
ncbi:MAG: M48 family metallopeptidase [Flavobacteriales bacterium]|nr:M48 family metallopeptidase [Flavobacteriales bacterium]